MFDLAGLHPVARGERGHAHRLGPLGSVTRHTVPPVLACEELTMASGPPLGQVWSADRPVTENQTNHYLKLAGLTRAGAVLKMIDKDVKLVKAKYKGADIWVDLRKVEGPAKDNAYAEVVVTDRTPKLGPGSNSTRWKGGHLSPPELSG